MTSSSNLDQMTPKQLRGLAEQAMQLLSQVDSMSQKIQRLETVNEQLAHEIAILKRHKFASPFCETSAVVYDFSLSRAGEHARNFLQDWKGKLVCDDFGGYKASFELGVIEIGSMAHARRKFFELHATHKSTLAEQALRYMQTLYEIESEIKDLEPDLRLRIRQEKSAPVMDALHAWMVAKRDIVHNGSAIGKALDYSLKRWTALSRYLDDGAVPIDNNCVRTRYGLGRWGARTGSSLGRYAAANAPLR